MFFDKAYYINLEESVNRREKFLKSAYRADITPEHFTAIKGDRVNIQEYEESGILESPFNLRMAGSLGCLLSHITLWDKISKDPNIEVALIFEDDARIGKNFKKKLKSIPIDMVPEDWDMIWLGWHKLKCKPINRFFGKPFGTKKNSGHFCYLIKSSSIHKIKSLLIPYNNMVSKDVVLRRNFDNFNAYFLRKRIARTPFIEWKSIRKSLNKTGLINR